MSSGDDWQEDCCLFPLIHCNLQLTRGQARADAGSAPSPNPSPRTPPGVSHSHSHTRCQHFTPLSSLRPPKQPLHIYIRLIRRYNLISGQPSSSAAAHELMQMDLIVAVSINWTHALTSVTLTSCYYCEACVTHANALE